MAEKIDNIEGAQEIPPQTAKPVSASSNDPNPALKDAPKKSSAGEKIFNWTVYGGLNYWANLGISLVIIDFFRVKKGKEWITNGVEKLTKTISGATGISEAAARKQSQFALDQLTYPSGGWFILAPMKYMEDHKRPIVHWLNKKLGVDQHAPDGHEMTPDEIYVKKEQPYQTWGNVIKRRIIATGAVFGSGLVLKNTIGEEPITNFVVGNANKAFNSGFVPGGKWAATTPWFQRYLGYASLDAIYTKVTALVMHMTNGAKKAKMPKEIGDDFDPAGDDSKPNEIQIAPEQADKKHSSTIKPREKTDVPQKSDSFGDMVNSRRQAADLQVSIP